MKKDILVFNGFASSGKSTIAKLLEQEERGRFKFYPEVGDKVVDELGFHEDGKNEFKAGEFVDLEILKRELQRDNEELIKETKVPIVETWHTGNAAYAVLRNPHLLEKFESAIKDQLKLFNPTVIMFDIKREVFELRNKYDEPIEELVQFYTNLKNFLYELYERLNIKYYLVENNGTIEECLRHMDKNIFSNLSFLNN